MKSRLSQKALSVLRGTWPQVSPYVNAHPESGDLALIKEDQKELVQNPDVSVLVVTWRHEKYIRECIEAICRQKSTYSFEVIIGEDCSPDRTREICFELQRQYPKNIRVVHSKNNVGLAANTYRVARQVRGRFVAICEGDDFWIDPKKLQKEVGFLEGHLEYDAVHTACYHQYERNKLCRCPLAHRTIRRLLSYNSLSLEQQRRLLADHNFISTPTLVARRDAYLNAINCIRELESITGWVPSADYVTNFFVAQKGKLHFIQDITAVYRINAGSLTGICDKKKALARMLGDARNRLVLISMVNRDLESDAGIGRVEELSAELDAGTNFDCQPPHPGPLYFLMKRLAIALFGI